MGRGGAGVPSARGAGTGGERSGGLRIGSRSVESKQNKILHAFRGRNKGVACDRAVERQRVRRATTAAANRNGTQLATSKPRRVSGGTTLHNRPRSEQETFSKPKKNMRLSRNPALAKETRHRAGQACKARRCFHSGLQPPPSNDGGLVLRSAPLPPVPRKSGKVHVRRRFRPLKKARACTDARTHAPSGRLALLVPSQHRGTRARASSSSARPRARTRAPARGALPVFPIQTCAMIPIERRAASQSSGGSLFFHSQHSSRIFRTMAVSSRRWRTAPRAAQLPLTLLLALAAPRTPPGHGLLAGLLDRSTFAATPRHCPAPPRITRLIPVGRPLA